jgi:hypothetical protein
MQEGSRVMMAKPIDEKLYQAMLAYMIKPPPVPNDVVSYIVTGMVEVSPESGYTTGIYLDAYPEYEEAEVPFNAELFVELEPLKPKKISKVYEESRSKETLVPV